MKAILALLIFLPILSYGQCFITTHEGVLNAVVQGDTVTLRNDSVCRTCGANYVMKMYDLGNDTLIWTQVNTAGVAYCECNYNLSVIIDSLHPGIYITKVYYTWSGYADSSYIGTISFTISDQNLFQTPKLSSQYQSLCYPTNLTAENNDPKTFVKIFPNPSEGIFNIISELEGEKVICITDINSKSILDIVTYKNKNVIDISNLPKGIYFIKIMTKEKSTHSKICIY